MKKRSVSFFVLLTVSVLSFAQQNFPVKLKVFIDCNSTWCDMQYIRSEINIVDFLLDNAASDVHVLVTSQGTGGGGEQYQLIFFGQRQFKSQTDTLQFNNDPNATEFERRDLLLKYLKTGLVPFIAKTAAVKNMDIGLKTTDTTGAGNADSSITKDPWNYWVMRVGVDINLNGDANYKNTSYNGNLSVNRITDKLKIGMRMYWNKHKSTFKYDNNGIAENFEVNNHNWSINPYFVKSINSHWSWAYEVRFNQNTFSNNKARAYMRAAVEYNIFPYKEVNTKLFTLSYGLTARRNNYYDTTVYNKVNETLYGHRVDAYFSLNQKWGTSYAGISYHNYFHNWKLFNLGFDIYNSVRITGGLSFYFFAFGGLTRSQVFLVKGNATSEEVLARRRQLASGYNYYTGIGINYRFGSKLNNIVNPRFDRSGNLNED